MIIDHIFIFTENKGKVAEELVSFGFAEGSSRIHVGQGTANRKFYFENFFLEILWVNNPKEIRSDKVFGTGLWQRSEFLQNNFSPYGLCLVNEPSTDKLFEDAFEYQPDYFPSGMAIEILKNTDSPSLPWTFRLPFKEQSKNGSEPKMHKNGISKLTSAKFAYSEKESPSYLSQFSEERNIKFLKEEKPSLTLTFDKGRQGLEKYFASLGLNLKY